MRRCGRIRRGESIAAIAAVSLATLICACVGGEGTSASRERSSEDTIDRTVVSGSATSGWDSLPTLDYRLFEWAAWPGDSSRALTRLMVMRTAENAGEGALAKTLMVALDSIAGSDTSLVAVRGILYTARPTGPGRANLVPAVWGEWVPPGGWDAERPRRGRQAHRTFLYHLDPGWRVPEPPERAEVESE